MSSNGSRGTVLITGGAGCKFALRYTMVGNMWPGRYEHG